MRTKGGEICFTDEDIEKATISRMKMKKPTAVDQVFILKWMKEEGIECVGSLEEADMQCVNDYVPRIKGNGAVAVVLGNLEENNLTAPLHSKRIPSKSVSNFFFC